MDEKLPELVAMGASLRHQAALCQSLSHPQLWMRADFAMTKAVYLLGQLGVPTILEHVERNIDSIVEFVNHIDELYIADLSEKSNENSTWLSMIFAAASLTLTILILPSFWADLKQTIDSQYQHLLPSRYLPRLELVGDILAMILFAAAIGLFIFALSRLIRVRWRGRKKSAG